MYVIDWLKIVFGYVFLFLYFIGFLGKFVLKEFYGIMKNSIYLEIIIISYYKI